MKDKMENREGFFFIPESAAEVSGLEVVNPRPRGFLRGIARLFLFSILLFSSIGGVLVFVLISHYSQDLPKIRSIQDYRPALPSIIYASDGTDKLAIIGSERRFLVPFERIPRQLVYAFIAAEDDRFFSHRGIDPLGIFRAVVKNLKEGRIKAGGSTITQQVAKSFLFDRLVIKIVPGLCRSDGDCDWDKKCKSMGSSPFGRCVKREFKSCGRQVTIIYRGKPTKIYRGYTTLCDSKEVCRPSCKEKEVVNSGFCPQWTCVPQAPKPLCQADSDCGFGQVCSRGECKQKLEKQLLDLLDLLVQSGAEIRYIRAPRSVLENLPAQFEKRPGRRISISAKRAANVDIDKLSRLPGVKSVYRFAEKSLRRKIREAILAVRLERQFSKEQILWLYLNHIYLGHQSYGVQAAAQNYFGKNVWELNLAESAILAALPKAPSAYDPYRNLPAARRRMRYVLSRMLTLGFITKEEYSKALRTPIRPHPLPSYYHNKTPYFTAEVHRRLIRKLGKRRLERGGFSVFATVDPEKQMLGRNHLRKGIEELDMRQGYRGPLGIIPKKYWNTALDKAEKFYQKAGGIELGKVYAGLVTKIDRRRQRVTVMLGKTKGILPLAGMLWAGKPHAFRSYRRPRISRIGKTLQPGYWILVEPVKPKSLRTGNRSIDRTIPSRGLVLRLRQFPKVQGALLSIDHNTGYFETIVGGYSYRRSQFNRALYACRQPGSSFKPIVYATALELGVEKEKNGRVEREPITLGSLILDAPLVYDSGTDPDASRYKPSNYTGTYEGLVTVFRALTRSMNIPTIKLMLKVGMDNVINFARRFGITTPLRKELGLALGQSCVRPWELTLFYATIARGGIKPDPKLIKLILDRNGRIVEDHRSFDDPFLSPESKLNRLEAELFKTEERLLSKNTAYLLTYLLRNVVLQGTGYKVKRLQKPAAGKTGTTNDSFDVWFVGFTKPLTTAVWLGFDKNERPLGSWESGGETAAPVWLNYMRDATRGQKWNEWTPTPDIIWERIDPKTGKLANVDTPNALRLPFIRGTEPQEKTAKRTNINVEQFYTTDEPE